MQLLVLHKKILLVYIIQRSHHSGLAVALPMAKAITYGEVMNTMSRHFLYKHLGHLSTQLMDHEKTKTKAIVHDSIQKSSLKAQKKSAS